MNLLSIRGGGSRFLIPALILITIQEKTGKPISELFDYLSGCSAGSLLVTAVLISQDGKNPIYSAHEVYDLFLKHIRNSFTWTWWYYMSTGFGLFGSKYTSNGLQNIVTETCQDMTMKHLLKPVIFPAYDRVKNRPFYFDRSHADVKIVDCIMATTAIPTYFQSHKMTIDDQLHDFLDSALVTNDASNLVLLKATSIRPVDKSKIILLNLGTGKFPNKTCESNGLLSWASNIVDVLVTGSEYNETYQVSLSLPEDNHYILDIPLDKAYAPDDISEATIQYYIKTTEKWIEDNNALLDTICHKLLSNI